MFNRRHLRTCFFSHMNKTKLLIFEAEKLIFLKKFQRNGLLYIYLLLLKLVLSVFLKDNVVYLYMNPRSQPSSSTPCLSNSSGKWHSFCVATCKLSMFLYQCWCFFRNISFGENNDWKCHFCNGGVVRPPVERSPL